VLCTVNPQAFANILWNAVAISEEPKDVEGWPHILLGYEDGRAYAYGMGRYAAGYGFCETMIAGDEPASVCITREEAESLQSTVRSLTASKTAECTFAIHPDGLQLDDGSVVHLTIEYNERPVAQLPDSDPEARGDCFWDGIDELVAEARSGSHVAGPMATGFDTLKRLTKLKPPQLVVDMVPLRGTTKPVKAIGCQVGPRFTAVLGLTDRDLFAGSAELDERFGKGTPAHLLS